MKMFSLDMTCKTTCIAHGKFVDLKQQPCELCMWEVTCTDVKR